MSQRARSTRMQRGERQRRLRRKMRHRYVKIDWDTVPKQAAWDHERDRVARVERIKARRASRLVLVSEEEREAA